MSGMGRPKRGGGIEAVIFIWLVLVGLPLLLAIAAMRSH